MKILARIPQDNGKKIAWDATYSSTVQEELCEFCQLKHDQNGGNGSIPPATVVVEGDRDSWGREVHSICDKCLKGG